MPVERRPISVSQLSELLGVDPARFIAVEHVCDRGRRGWYIVTEPEDDMQTTGTLPQIHSNTSYTKERAMAGYGKGGGSAKTPKKGSGPKKG